LRSILHRCILFAFISTVSPVNSQNLRHVTALVPFATGLTTPVCITNAGDDRLFVIDQHGMVMIVDSAGTVFSEPFLNIKDRTVYGGERGLLGMAFHPGYDTNGYFYVNYTGAGDSTHISRFGVTSDNPDKADSLSEFKIMTIAQPFENHKGGNLGFGPDGYLYIGMGDGGSGGDPGKRAQNPGVLLGKMLRIDVDSGNPYSIPPSNPFVNDTTVRHEIWALGLRNPWRFSFDRLTGDLWIADVGQDDFEEINFQPVNSTGGENYGWRCYEGDQPFNTEDCAPASAFTFPVYVYPHGSECSVTGGYVQRGDTTSPYFGYYFFADYCSDRLWSLHNESGVWVKDDLGQFTGNSFSAFGEDTQGRMYIAGLSSGNIYRITGQLSGIPEPGKKEDIKILRYSSSNRIHIEINSDIPLETSISLYDMRGIKQFHDITTERTYEFEPVDLASGMYLVMVRANGKVRVEKIFVGKTARF